MGHVCRYLVDSYYNSSHKFAIFSSVKISTRRTYTHVFIGGIFGKCIGYIVYLRAVPMETKVYILILYLRDSGWHPRIYVHKNTTCVHIFCRCPFKVWSSHHVRQSHSQRFIIHIYIYIYIYIYNYEWKRVGRVY
jgi:hypothetical protein